MAGRQGGAAQKDQTHRFTKQRLPNTRAANGMAKAPIPTISRTAIFQVGRVSTNRNLTRFGSRD